MTSIGANEELHTAPAHRADRGRHAASASSFGIGSLIGAGVVVLAILGSLGLWPRVLMAISIIGVGAALFFDAAASGARPPGFRSATPNRSAAGLEFIGAAGAIVLGILALINILPTLLMDIATIAYGGALVLGAGGGVYASATTRREDLALPAVVATYQAARPVAGMAAVILGIFSLTTLGKEYQSLFLELSLLAVGSALFLGGLALSGAHTSEAT